MDVDVDLDHELFNKLNAMGTRDHEDLVSQFQSIVGSQISPGGCAFYLEMANWNLQSALCAYYDIMSTNEKLPEMKLVEDVTLKDGNVLVPKTPVIKTWKLKNSGTERWPNGLKLKYARGYKFGDLECVSVPSIEPDECTDVSLYFDAPVISGEYESQWRLVTVTGTYCGEMLNIALRVEENSMISLTEQMSNLGRAGDTTPVNHSLSQFPLRAEPITAPSRTPVAPTPFCSPTGYGIFGGSPVAPFTRSGTLPTIDESNLSNQFCTQATIFELNQPDRCNGFHDDGTS